MFLALCCFCFEISSGYWHCLLRLHGHAGDGSYRWHLIRERLQMIWDVVRGGGGGLSSSGQKILNKSFYINCRGILGCRDVDQFNNLRRSDALIHRIWGPPAMYLPMPQLAEKAVDFSIVATSFQVCDPLLQFCIGCLIDNCWAYSSS